MRRRYFTLDVFTTKRFAGNPLAVVLDPVGLDGAAMQAIAREFNLPETVFVYPPDDPGHRARLRIFTPARELPFAGHPTVGTAVLLGRLDGGTAERKMVLGETIGSVPCVVTPSTAGGRASFGIPRAPERTGPAKNSAGLAAALGLEPGDIGCEDFSPDAWSAGNPFTFVPVRGLDAMRRARPDNARWAETFDASDPPGVFLFCREVAEPGHSFHARMFAPSMGIPEDPATGSALAAFAGILAASGTLADGAHSFAVEQGYEMGRQSLMTLTLTMAKGTFAAASIGGEAVVVGEGAIEA